MYFKRFLYIFGACYSVHVFKKRFITLVIQVLCNVYELLQSIVLTVHKVSSLSIISPNYTSIRERLFL